VKALWGGMAKLVTSTARGNLPTLSVPPGNDGMHPATRCMDECYDTVNISPIAIVKTGGLKIFGDPVIERAGNKQ